MLRSRFLLPALLAAAILPYFIGLGSSSIWDANEAYYVETPREMIESGDYVSPTFNYEPRLNKPVLSYWIVAAFYRLFGISVGVERIPIAIGALILILTAGVLAKAATAGEESGSPGRATDAALWAALGLAVAPRLLMFARRIFIDIYISMFMGLTLLFFALAERYPARRRLFLILMYVAVGLGMLTKGPIAALLPGLVFALYLFVHRELKRVTEMMLPAGIALVLALVVPYYAALYARHGSGPITAFFVGENVERFTEGVGVEASRPAYFYLPVVFSDSFPWSLLLVGAAVLWFGDRRLYAAARLRAAHVRDAAADAQFRIRTLLWLWTITVVGFFSLSEAKQDLYIFPIVPAVAALGGTFVARAWDDRGRAWSLLRALTAAIGVLVAVAGIGALYIFQASGKVYALDGAATVGVIGAAGGLATLALALANRARAALLITLTSAIALNWMFVLVVLPSFERYKPVPTLSAIIAARATPEDVIAHYNVALPSMVYYLRRHIDVLFTSEPLLERLRGPRRVYAVLSDEDYARIESSIGVPTCIIGRSPTVNVKLKWVLARKPLPEVLLITNYCNNR
jgi:4-amino-4-deoxy-L-arabinose transferase-like glycosyltransferase